MGRMKLAPYVTEASDLVAKIPRAELLIKKRSFANDDRIIDPRKAFVWYVMVTCFRKSSYVFYDKVRSEVSGTNDNHWYTLFDYVLRVYHGI